MAFAVGRGAGSLEGRDVVRDANPGSNSLRYRSMLKEIDNGLGERDMDKLKYLCQDLGVAPRSMESVKRGIHLFTELEKLLLITPDDISLLVTLMQTINRFDLAKKLKSWSSKDSVLAHRLSPYRKLMLKISDSLSKDERDQFMFYLQDGNQIPVSVAEECKTLLQLFIQMEKYAMVAPDDVNLLNNVISAVGNMAVVKEIEKYQASAPVSSFGTPVARPSRSEMQSSQSWTGSSSEPPSNKRSNSDPTFGTYNQQSATSLHSSFPAQQQFPGFRPSQPPQQQYQPHQQQYQQHQQQYQPPQQHFQPPQQNVAQHQQSTQSSSGQHSVATLQQQVSTSMVGMEKPSWYFDAVRERGLAYADKLFENFLGLVHRENVRKQMEKLSISQENASVESVSSIKTENTDDPNEEEVRNLQGESQGSTCATREPSRIVPAQTAKVTPHPARDMAVKPADLLRYRMERQPRGLCIIFNAENFQPSSENLTKRDGTQEDVGRLLNTFEQNLKFDVEIINDPTKDKYLHELRQIHNRDHSQYDAFACIILSHGCKGHVYGVDGRKVAIDALTGLFRGEYTPTLAGKPKLFFIQACQGNIAQDAVKIEQDAVLTVPNESDTLVSLSTVPGYASNRSPTQGTWFITTLCHVVNSNYRHYDLLSMLTMVNYELSRAADAQSSKQIAYPSHTLRKQVYFNHGLQ